MEDHVLQEGRNRLIYMLENSVMKRVADVFPICGGSIFPFPDGIAGKDSQGMGRAYRQLLAWTFFSFPICGGSIQMA